METQDHAFPTKPDEQLPAGGDGHMICVLGDRADLARLPPEYQSYQMLDGAIPAGGAVPGGAHLLEACSGGPSCGGGGPPPVNTRIASEPVARTILIKSSVVFDRDHSCLYDPAGDPSIRVPVFEHGADRAVLGGHSIACPVYEIRQAPAGLAELEGKLIALPVVGAHVALA